MSRSQKTQALACGGLLIAAMLAAAIKMLGPVDARPRLALGSNPSKKLPAAQSNPMREPPSFEIPSRWDEGALWDDEAPAYDVSQPDR